MSRRLPPLSAVRAFDAAARHGTFSKAAEDLGVTHSAISKQVRQLETHLGVKLFERAGRAVRPTLAGATLAQRLDPIFGQLAAAFLDLDLATQPRRLSVRVETDMAQLWLLPALATFQAMHPDLELSLTTENDLTLLGPEVDIAIAQGTGAWRDCEFELLLRNHIFPVVRPELWTADAAADPGAFVRRSELIHYKNRKEWERLFKALGLPPQETARGAVYDPGILALDVEPQ